MRATITTTYTKPLCCKELAVALSVSVSFVYKMRSAGFEMTWDSELRCKAATVGAAKGWLRRTEFRIVRGSGRVTK